MNFPPQTEGREDMEAQASDIFGRVSRKGILTLDNGTRIMADFRIRPKDMMWHKEFEKSLVDKWNKSQPGAAHKVVSIHLMRN